MIDASRDMLDCDNLLDELEDLIGNNHQKLKPKPNARAFASFAHEGYVPDSNA